MKKLLFLFILSIGAVSCATGEKANSGKENEKKEEPKKTNTTQKDLETM